LPIVNKMVKTPSEIKQSAWYAIYTRSRHEAKVETGLTGIGYENFLPRITVPSRRHDRKQMISVPLFPGYLFVHTELKPTDYHRIVKVIGVVSILGIKGLFIPIPMETIDSLKRLVASGRPYYNWEYLKKGDLVRILEGPLAGTVGIFLRRHDNKSRLVVSVELMGRSVAVDLNGEMVEQLHSNSPRHSGRLPLTGSK
jgi:transcription termination/antitermination protein NusG